MEIKKNLDFFLKLYIKENKIIKKVLYFLGLFSLLSIVLIILLAGMFDSGKINIFLALTLSLLSTISTLSALLFFNKIIEFAKNLFILKINEKEIINIIADLNIKYLKKEGILSIELFKKFINNIEGTKSELYLIKDSIIKINSVNKLDTTIYVSIIDILIEKYKEKINLEKIFTKNETLNGHELVFLDLLNEKLINTTIIKNYINPIKILNNEILLKQLDLKKDVYNNLIEKIKLEKLTELIFEKENTKFIDEEYYLNVWNFLNGSNFSKILELRKLILEDIIESENENFIINYKEDFLELVDEIKCKDLDKVFILKQKLKKTKEKEFRIIQI